MGKKSSTFEGPTPTWKPRKFPQFRRVLWRNHVENTVETIKTVNSLINAQGVCQIFSVLRGRLSPFSQMFRAKEDFDFLKTAVIRNTVYLKVRISCGSMGYYSWLNSGYQYHCPNPRQLGEESRIFSSVLWEEAWNGPGCSRVFSSKDEERKVCRCSKQRIKRYRRAILLLRTWARRGCRFQMFTGKPDTSILI